MKNHLKIENIKNALKSKDVPLELIASGLKDYDCDVREAAMNACKGRDLSLEVIECWSQNINWCFRVAAMNACNRKDVPLRFILCGLNDADGGTKYYVKL